MPKKLLLILLLCTFSAARGFADTSIGNEATDQLAGQSRILAEETKKPAAASTEKPEVVLEKEPEAPPSEEGPSFMVTGIRLDGNTLFPDEAFEKIIRSYENRSVSFKELRTLCQEITNFYRVRGLVTSRAYIPPQGLENGSPLIRIIEGKVGEISVSGNRYFSKESYLYAFRLNKDKILRFQEVESSLSELNQNPRRKAKAYLNPGKEPGTSDISLQADEKFPVSAYYEYNNRGTKFTHRSRHILHVDDASLFGRGDILATNFTMAEEGAFDGGGFDYNFPIPRTGTTLNLGVSFAKSTLIGSLKPLEVTGESLDITPGITQSFYRTAELKVDGFVGFDYVDSRTAIDGSKFSFDRMRVLKAGPRLSWQDGSGKNFFSSDIHWGIPDFLGGLKENDPEASRPNSGGDFTFYTASLARLQKLPWNSYAILRADGQWTPDTLTSIEQYRLGGAYTVRGYPESDSVGDYGFNFSAELNHPIPFLPDQWRVPYTKKSWKDSLRMVEFLDGGKTYLRERTSDSAVKDRFLLGIGTGLRWDLDDTKSLVLDFGFPIGDDSTDKNNMQTRISAKGGF